MQRMIDEPTAMLQTSTNGSMPVRRPLATVVVPAYNEGAELFEHLATLMDELDAGSCAYDYEVVVVDDGSSDDTYEAADRAGRRYANLRVVRHRENRGMGCALRTGFAAARGSAIVVYDSDLSYEPAIVRELLAQLDTRGADLALASPYMRGGSVKNVPWLRRILSREANRFLSFATNGRYATVTGMVRAYRTAFVRALKTHEERMEINVELLFKAIKAGARIVEVPARLEWSPHRARSRSRPKLAPTAKQIGRTLRYGVAHRPAVLLALPGILPGVLPLVIALCAIARADLKTLGIVTAVTMIIQNASLALFAGQLGVFFRNGLRRSPRSSAGSVE